MHDLQDDQDPERARRPDQMVVEAERGGVVFLHKSPFGLLGRKQPARHAMAERRGRYAQGELSTALAPQMPIKLRQPPTACAPRTKRTPTRPPKLWPTACPLGGRQSGETTIASIRQQVQ